jgi:hypothetical protein
VMKWAGKSEPSVETQPESAAVFETVSMAMLHILTRSGR